MAYRTLSAVCTLALPLLLAGCAALGLLSGAATMATQSGNPRSGSPPLLPGTLAGAGHSIFQVVAWGMALILGALVLAFVARLLNGRNRASSSKPTQQFPSSAGGDPGPLETDRATRRQPLKES